MSGSRGHDRGRHEAPTSGAASSSATTGPTPSAEAARWAARLAVRLGDRGCTSSAPGPSPRRPARRPRPGGYVPPMTDFEQAVRRGARGRTSPRSACRPSAWSPRTCSTAPCQAAARGGRARRAARGRVARRRRLPRAPVRLHRRPGGAVRAVPGGRRTRHGGPRAHGPGQQARREPEADSGRPGHVRRCGRGPATGRWPVPQPRLANCTIRHSAVGPAARRRAALSTARLVTNRMVSCTRGRGPNGDPQDRRRAELPGPDCTSSEPAPPRTGPPEAVSRRCRRQSNRSTLKRVVVEPAVHGCGRRCCRTGSRRPWITVLALADLRAELQRVAVPGSRRR